MKEIQKQVFDAMNMLLDNAALSKEDIVVLGCSTSEIAGTNIGTGSVYSLGEEVISGALAALRPRGVYLAVGCCEHINRAVVIERAAANRYGLEPVCVIPQVKAGGSAGTAAYRHFESPIMVEFVQANAGMDIGGTLIGMHLRHVAVPLRLPINKIGHAGVAFAKTRPKLIGGERAVYTDSPNAQ